MSKQKDQRERRPRGYGSIQKIAGSVYARWTVAGVDHRIPAKDDRDAEGLLAYVHALRQRHGLSVVDALARLDEEQTTPARGGPGQTFARVFGLYLDDCDRTEALRASTRRSNRERSGVLKAAAWACLPLEDIRRKAVRAWVADRMTKGTSGKSVVNDLTLASSVWAFAEERGLVDDEADNPFLRARPKRYARKTRQALTPEELLALREAVRSETPDLYPYFLAVVFSGWRAGEVAGLREADLVLESPDGPRLTIDKARTKGKVDQVAYIAEPLVSILREQQKARPRLPTALLFTTRNGRPWTPWNRLARLRQALAAVPADAIPAIRRKGDKARLGLDWHSLRHTVSTLLAARGHRDAAIGELLGQADPATRRRYTHPYEAEAKAIAADLAGFLAPSKSKRAGT